MLTELRTHNLKFVMQNTKCKIQNSMAETSGLKSTMKIISIQKSQHDVH